MSAESERSPAPGDSYCAIGVDVGGTKIAAGIVTLPDARVYTRRIVPTLPQRGGEPIFADVRNLIEDLAVEAGALNRVVRGLGIGVCELVTLAGEVASANTVAWKGMPIQARLALLAPAVIEADVRAAALAEARFGAGRPFTTFLYLTVGTGISSCLVIERKPFAGARGAAGTIASSPLNCVCEQCGAIDVRTLEEVASGPALVSRYNRNSGGRANSGEEVAAAADSGDPAAIAVMRTGGEALGRTGGFLVNALDPEAVIVGGGLGLSGGIFWDSFEAAARRQIWSESNREVPIIHGGLGPDAGLIGAATAAWLKLAAEPTQRAS
jgi:glucokinase